MALRFPEPDDVERLLSRAAAALGENLGADVQLSRPLEVETWRYVNNENLTLPTPGPRRRWQCLAGVDGPAAVVDLVEDAGDFVVVSVSWGTLAVGLNEAVAFAEAELAGSGDYVVRALEVPSLHFASLHLEGPSDVVIPMARAPGADLTNLTVVPIEELAGLLRSLSQRLGG